MLKTLTLTVFLAALPVAAQPPRGMYNWWDSPVAKDLNLSEDQTKQIKAAVRDSRAKLIDTRASVEKAELELQDAFNEDVFNPHKANEAIERLIAARGEMTRTFSQMSVKLRGILTAQQWGELQKRRPRGEPGEALIREMQRRRGMEQRGRRTPPPPPQESKQF